MSYFVLYSFQYTDPSNPLLRSFDSFWLSLTTSGLYNFVSLIVKTWPVLASAFLVPFEAKTQYFVYLSFNWTMQLINGISSDLQTLFRYFYVTAIVVFLKIPFVPSASVFPNYLVLYLKDLKSSVFASYVIIKTSRFIFWINPKTTWRARIIRTFF